MCTVSFSIRLYIFSSFFPSVDIPSILNSRAVDPDLVNSDPDPAFQMNPDPIRIQGFDDQKLKEKITDEKFFIKNCNLLMSKQQEKASALKREHPALQKMKFINGSFLPSWIGGSGLRIRIHSTAELDLEITRGPDPRFSF